jgi:hypothetical protein
MNRVLAAARLHVLNPLVMLGVPWAVVLSSFGINLAVWALTPAGEEPGGGFTGGILSLYITVLVVFAQAATQLLPFGMGLSLSRRTFYLGTALVAVVQSLLYGVALAVLGAIEEATGGWGMRLRFWAPGGMDADGFLSQVLVSGGPMLAFTFVGVALGVAYKRWGQTGIWGLLIAAIVVLGGLGILITWLGAWGDIGSWLGDQPLFVLAVALPAALAGVAAALSFAGLRRAVP